MGLAMFAPSTALEAVTGFPVWASIVCTGVVAVIYTTLVSSMGVVAVIYTTLVSSTGVVAVIYTRLVSKSVQFQHIPRV